MKLIVAILSGEDASIVLDEFLKHGLKVTKISSTGGFLKTGNTTLLSGVDEAKVEQAIGLMRGALQSGPIIIDSQSSFVHTSHFDAIASLGSASSGGTIFILDVERFVRF